MSLETLRSKRTGSSPRILRSKDCGRSQHDKHFPFRTSRTSYGTEWRTLRFEGPPLLECSPSVLSQGQRSMQMPNPSYRAACTGSSAALPGFGPAWTRSVALSARSIGLAPRVLSADCTSNPGSGATVVPGCWKYSVAVFVACCSSEASQTRVSIAFGPGRMTWKELAKISTCTRSSASKNHASG